MGREYIDSIETICSKICQAASYQIDLLKGCTDMKVWICEVDKYLTSE